MNNMTNNLRKNSHSENTEFSRWLVVVVFYYDDPLNQGHRLQTEETFLGNTAISLSAAWWYCTLLSSLRSYQRL